MRVVIAAVALFFFFGSPLAARPDDFGPRRDVAQVRSDALRLLAQRVRQSGVDPKNVKVTDVVVVRDQALLSWDSGKQHGVMGLLRNLDRWWGALDFESVDDIDQRSLKGHGFTEEFVTVASAHNSDVAKSKTTAPNAGATDKSHGPTGNDDPIQPAGATLWPWRQNTAGYDIHVSYTKNDASPGTKFARIYARAPTPAEMLPNPPPPRNWGGPTDVCYFDLEVGGAKPVTFQNGTKVDVWFPFVLDDQLRYRLSFVSAGKIYQPITGKIFDNVLHFELPSFAIAPGKAFQAEIEGWW